MQRIILILSVLIIGVGCKNKNEEIQFNESVVTHFSEFSKSLASEMEVIKNSEDSITKIEAIEQLEQATNKALKEIEQLKTPATGVEYHNAVIHVLQTVKDTYIPANKEFIYLHSDSTDSEQDNLMVNKINEISKKIRMDVTEAQDRQKEFSEKINSKLTK
ncbi:MAG TPA: hypothetical protein VLZ83_00935 [Edaphocola sp.]|nr:hypothetical protein [Edaphocola sp.]